jgi:hypothetical protein
MIEIIKLFININKFELIENLHEVQNNAIIMFQITYSDSLLKKVSPNLITNRLVFVTI